MAKFWPNLARLVLVLTFIPNGAIFGVNGDSDILEIGRLSLRNLSPLGNVSKSTDKVIAFQHRLKPAIISTPSTCFNVTVIQKTVFKSHVVFAGKIVKLTEHQITVDPPTTTVLPEDSSGYYFYSKTRRRVNTAPVKPKPKSIQYVATVTIKTVFKGREDLEGKTVQIAINPPGKLSSDSVLTQPRCLRRLRSMDTRIFFYTEDTANSALKKQMRAGREEDEDFRGKWTQLLIPLPPTLRILDVVRTAVKGRHSWVQFWYTKTARLFKRKLFCIDTQSDHFIRTLVSIRFAKIASPPIIYVPKFFCVSRFICKGKGLTGESSPSSPSSSSPVLRRAEWKAMHVHNSKGKTRMCGMAHTGGLDSPGFIYEVLTVSSHMLRFPPKV